MEYKTPQIKKIVTLDSGREFLSGSVVEKTSVKSMGQEVVDFDFSGDDFNHEWEFE